MTSCATKRHRFRHRFHSEKAPVPVLGGFKTPHLEPVLGLCLGLAKPSNSRAASFDDRCLFADLFQPRQCCEAAHIRCSTQSAHGEGRSDLSMHSQPFAGVRSARIAHSTRALGTRVSATPHQRATLAAEIQIPRFAT